jgi:hypothetical protein
MKVEFGKIGLQENVIEKFGAHDEILQVRGEAYSSWSEKIVNDSHHTGQGSRTLSPGGKSLTGKVIGRTPIQRESRRRAFVEKLRMGVDKVDV